MQFILPTILLPLALAAPSVPRDTNSTAPAPWQITALNTHSPSGRPGNPPESTLKFKITDSSTTASCAAQWIQSQGLPLGVEQACENESGEGTWSFKMLAGESASSASNFGLIVKFADVDGKVSAAKEQFSVGDNLKGTCGGSGQCNWQLSTVPLELKPSED